MKVTAELALHLSLIRWTVWDIKQLIFQRSLQYRWHLRLNGIANHHFTCTRGPTFFLSENLWYAIRNSVVIFASASLYIMWKYSAIYSQCIALCCRMPISVQILFSREPTCDTSTPPLFLAHAFFSDHPAVIRYKILTPYIFCLFQWKGKRR